MGRSPYIVIPHIIEVESNAINQLTFLCKIIQNPPEKKKNYVIYLHFTEQSSTHNERDTYEM